MHKIAIRRMPPRRKKLGNGGARRDGALVGHAHLDATALNSGFGKLCYSKH